MVVPQATNPNRVAAQNWSDMFHFRFIAFLGRIKPPYKILSKSVEKQNNYGIVISTSFVRGICPKGEMYEIQGL